MTGAGVEATDLESLDAVRRLRERFQGLLVGLAVGDALASAPQVRRPGSVAPGGDLLGGGPFDLPRGAWSDDTAMALCLAESLLECRGFDRRDQLDRYRRWQQQGHLSATGECVGISVSVARVLAAGVADAEAAPAKEPLSRLGPAVMYHFADHKRALAAAADVTSVTCVAPDTLAACGRLAVMLHAALAGRPKSAVLAVADAPPFAEGATGAALEAALAAFASTSNYRDGVLQLVNEGGDSDVHAAVYGQLAGACYGLSSIPRVWRNSLIRNELIRDVADRLLTQALVDLAGDAPTLGGTG
jgi:ADP-ribosyl-[dinitrogen reductase] hydrolase